MNDPKASSHLVSDNMPFCSLAKNAPSKCRAEENFTDINFSGLYW